MNDSELIAQDQNWREQIATLRAQLAQRRPELVDAEAELADQLAAISAFEFKLKAHITPYTRQLDGLDAEIRLLRRNLRLRGEVAEDDSLDAFDAATWAHEQTIHESTDYRYRPAAEGPPPQTKLDADTKVKLKHLYRRLARRFHPDMGVDEADRAYRTEMMMAINTAYAAADMEKLLELATAPDAARRDEALTDKMLAEVLRRELAHVEKRLREIKKELSLLQKHRSHSLKKRQRQAQMEGRDWFSEIEHQLRERIAQRKVERDILLQQLEMRDEFDTAVSTEEFADVVWDATLDQVFEENVSLEEDRWIQRRRDRVYFEEDFDDDKDYE